MHSRHHLPLVPLRMLQATRARRPMRWATLRLGAVALALGASAVSSACEESPTTANDVPKLSSTQGVGLRSFGNDPDGQLVLEWNALMATVLAGQTPFAFTRFAATMQLAVFEAVNAITGKYEPYLTAACAGDPHAWGRRTCSAIPPATGASPEAAVVAAAHAVLVYYVPAAAPTLDAARDASLAAIPDALGKAAGIAVGEAAAAAMIALRADDGSAPPQFFLPTSTETGDWQLTPACPAAGGVFLHWQDVTPFGVRTSRQFRSHRPPPIVSARYTLDYEEVKTVGAIKSSARPQDRADVAQFYAALLAPTLWNQAARQVSAAQGARLSANARAFALLNMALADGLITVMETKYHYVFWRPETAIREAATDGNPRTTPSPDFAPFITSPCFPTYPSAHATASYAGRRIIEHIWGADKHSITLETPTLPHLSLHYTRIDRITDDIDDARVYGGIHFRFDQEAGALQGTRIGDYIFGNHLRRVKRNPE